MAGGADWVGTEKFNIVATTPGETQPAQMRLLIQRGAPMEWLAQTLVTVPVASGVDRPVIDRTGLTGNYGFTIQFAPAQAANPDPDRPSLFTALEESA